jgi:hypothetical protein
MLASRGALLGPTFGRTFCETLLGLMLVGAAVGCGGTPGVTEPGKAEPGGGMFAVTQNQSCARTNPGVGPVREGAVRQGSTVALARDGEKLLAYVADHDRRLLDVVDVSKGRVEAAIPLGGQPEQVMVLADGRVAVSITDESRIAVLEPTGNAAEPLVMRCSREVPAGPFGLAASPDDATVVVTSTVDSTLTALDAATFASTGIAAVPRGARGVLIDKSGKAYVSHVVGAHISVVDLAKVASSPKIIDTRVKSASKTAENLDLMTPRSGSQAYTLASVEISTVDRRSNQRMAMGGAGDAVTGEAPDALAGKAPPKPAKPSVPAKPKDPAKVTPPEPLEPPVKPSTGPEISVRIVVPMVSVDAGSPERPTQFYYGPPPVAGIPKQAPVAITIDPVAQKSVSSHVIATTPNLRSGECLLPRAAAFRAKNEKLYVTCLGIDTMLELDARAVDPMRAITRRFQLPKGPTGVALAEKEGVAVVWGQFDDALAVVPLDGGATTTIDLYRGPAMLDDTLRAGREVFYRTEDARITSDGAACSSCHPDGLDDGVTWSTPEGMRQTLMLAGRLHGTEPYGWTRKQGTLEEYIADTSRRLGGSGIDRESLKSLAKYAKNIPSPPASKVKSELANRGHELFMDRGCSGCHVGGVGTDAKSHNVLGTTSSSDEIDTPSLIRVRMSGPYFHDGRYRSLDDVLADKSSKMGNTSSLSSDDQAAMRAYLESL